MNADSALVALHASLVSPYESVCERVRVALKAAGFEISAEIDLTDVLARKTGSHIRPYRILVAFHPKIADRMLTIAPASGVVLPFNVAVAQLYDEQVEVTIADPLFAWNAIPEERLKPLAEELSEQLHRVIGALRG